MVSKQQERLKSYHATTWFSFFLRLLKLSHTSHTLRPLMMPQWVLSCLPPFCLSFTTDLFFNIDKSLSLTSVSTEPLIWPSTSRQKKTVQTNSRVLHLACEEVPGTSGKYMLSTASCSSLFLVYFCPRSDASVWRGSTCNFKNIVS